MPRIFISHSSHDAEASIAVKQWLIEQDHDLADAIFLDIDPSKGIAAGKKWKPALQHELAVCEAIVCLVSTHWIASVECLTEARTVETRRKPVFAAHLEPIDGEDITREWQRVDLHGPGPSTAIDIDYKGSRRQVVLRTAGLLSLLHGLQQAGLAGQQFAWPPADDPDRAPYPGWRPFGEVDAAVYFGRDTQIQNALTRLCAMRSERDKSMFVVLGPSGTGKSSFLTAGVLPRLRRSDQKFTVMDVVRPKRHSITGEQGLAAALHGLHDRFGLVQPSLGDIKSALAKGDDTQFGAWLFEIQSAAAARSLDPDQGAPILVLPIDQAEELFPLDTHPGHESTVFLTLLRSVLSAPVPERVPLIVAVTIRTDRYAPMQTAPVLEGVDSALFDELKPMSRDRYREIITRPAARASATGRPLDIENTLVDALLEDCSDGADNLPLLALTLARLYQDYASTGQLTTSQYQSIGGIENVVRSEVANILSIDEQQRRDELSTLRRAFIPWLATVHPRTGQPMRRISAWKDLPADTHDLLRRFIDRRLLVMDHRDGEIVVEVALESLLRQWTDLRGWLDEEADNLKAADVLEHDAANWRNSECNQSWLLEGDRLLEAEILSKEPGFRERLSSASEFLAASWKRQTARAASARRLNRLLTAITLVAVIAAAVAGFWIDKAVAAEHEADARARAAIVERLTTDGTTMLDGHKPGGDVRAIQEILAAHALSPSVETTNVMTTAVYDRINLERIVQAPTALHSVALCADGTTLATSGGDGTILLWNIVTGQPIGQPLTGHLGIVWKVACSPDSRRLASAGSEGTVRLWDTTTGQQIGQPLTGGQAQVRDLAFSPDGRRLVSSWAAGTIRMWDVGTGTQLGDPWWVENAGSGQQLPLVRSVAFDRSGTRIVAGDENGAIWILNADTGEQVVPPWTGHYRTVDSVAFSPDGQHVVSGGFFDHRVRIWDASTGGLVGDITNGHTGGVYSVAYSADGTRIVSASVDRTVRVTDATTREPVVPPLTGNADSASGAIFGTDRDHVIAVGNDHTLRIWNLNTSPQVRQPLIGHTSPVWTAVFSPDGTKIASAGSDNTIRIWDADTGRTLNVLHADAVSAAVFSPDGTKIASANADSTIRIWDVGTGKALSALTGHTAAVSSAVWSRDGSKIVSASADGTIRIWDAGTGQTLKVLTGHFGPVSNAVISANGSKIVSAGQDQTVRIWDAHTGQLLHTLTGHTDTVTFVAINAEGSQIASASLDRTIRLWNTDTGKQDGDVLAGDSVSLATVAFSPDGTRIASGGYDHAVRIWDVRTGQQVSPMLLGHTSVVYSVAFSPDGTRIISAGNDGTIRQWSNLSATEDDLCARLTTNLSDQEWAAWISPAIPRIPVCQHLPTPNH